MLSPVVSKPAGPAKNVLGVFVDVTLDGVATGGLYTAYVLNVPPQAGPPPHRHDAFDEAFYVVSGAVEVVLGDAALAAGPGTHVFIPRGVVHAFRNVGVETATMLGTATPSGHEQFFEEADRLAAEGRMSMEDVLGLCARNGIEVVLPPAG